MNERILITGATGGIGQALAKQLAEFGYNLLLTGRSESKLSSLLASLPGGNHLIFAADLTQPTDVAELAKVAAAVEVFGVVNCLGVNQLSMLADLPQENIDQQLATNLFAPIAVCQALLPQLQRQTKSFIVNVGSILGSIGYAGSTVYCASKFGLRGFTESLRRELADTSVQVSYFAPRATATELNSEAMNELNQVLGNKVDSAESVALSLARWVMKKHGGNLYLGWPEAFFVRLNSLFPSLVDGALAKQLATIKRFCMQPTRG